MTPFSYWLYFHLAILLLMGAEYLLHLAVPDTRRKALYATILWVAAALALAAVLARPYGIAGATQYLAGYAIEQALSIDNLFVFLLLFGLFRIPASRQPRVLYWGVLGAILLRGLFIAAGVGLLQRFAWVDYIFGAILLFAAIRLLKPEDSDPALHTPAWIRWLTRLSPVSENQDHFFVKEIPTGKLSDPSNAQPSNAQPGNAQPGSNKPGSATPRFMVTILFLALLAVELTDVVFALDSIPAVLSITRVPFLAYTSNIMAVMNLRSLYVLLAVVLAKLRFVHFGLAAILAFAAIKMLITRWLEIGPLTSLAVIAILLTTTIAASLLFPKTKTPTSQPATR